MKSRVFSVLAMLCLVIAAFGYASPVSASGYSTTFATSITYLNVGTAAANLSINFYPEGNGTPITISRPALPKGGATSLFVGSLTELASGFKGTAALSSDQPIVATLVQLPQGTTDVKNRPMSNGMGETDGAASISIPTILKNTFNTNSIFSVQNIDTVGADLTVKFTPTSGSATTVTVNNLPAGAGKYFDMGTYSGISASTFNGSVTITAKKTGTSNAGKIIASDMELSTTSPAAYAFEGVSGGSSKLYMPSAFCNYQGTINSAYAIQNSGTVSVNVTVAYSNGKTEPAVALGPGVKKSYPGCGVSGSLNPAGFIGSAIITATASSGTPSIVGVGKITGSGLSTAFLGFNTGTAKIALPYVRYTQAHWTDGTKQRAFIAIQNVGSSNLAAGAVTVKYYDKSGNLVGTHTLGAINAGQKASSNPSNIGAAGNEFGSYSDGSFGGGAIVQGPSGSQLAVVVRVQTSTGGTTTVGEDYNGIPVQ